MDSSFALSGSALNNTAPMEIFRRVEEDLKAAMRAKDSKKLGVLRMLKSALSYAGMDAANSTGGMDDAACLAVVRKQIKQRQDSIASYEKGNRPDLVEAEKSELAILEAYLPQPLSPEEVQALVAECLAESGVTSKAGMGEVMKLATAKAGGRVDGQTLSSEVQNQLA